jgi:hypothetical protein
MLTCMLQHYQQNLRGVYHSNSLADNQEKIVTSLPMSVSSQATTLEVNA